MRRVGVVLCALFVIGLAGSAAATPVTIDLAGASPSSVGVTNMRSLGWTSLTAALAGNLGEQTFTLGHDQTAEFEFFTLTASGFGVGTADITASLGFDWPRDVPAASGSGDAAWGTFFGRISAGYLFWDPATLPDFVTLNDGNRLKIDFEDGVAVVCGNTATVHGYVTNLGGAPASVPDAGSSFLLLCLAGAGLGVLRRRWQ